MPKVQRTNAIAPKILSTPSPLLRPANGNWKAPRDRGGRTGQTVCMSGPRLWPQCVSATLRGLSQRRNRRPRRKLLSEDAGHRSPRAAALWDACCPSSHRKAVQLARGESGPADRRARNGPRVPLPRARVASEFGRARAARPHSSLARRDETPIWCAGRKRSGGEIRAAIRPQGLAFAGRPSHPGTRGRRQQVEPVATHPGAWAQMQPRGGGASTVIRVLERAYP